MWNPLNILERVVLYVIIEVLHMIHTVINILNYWKVSEKCPPIEDELLMKSAVSLTEMIRKQEITSEIVVQAYIARIKAVNPVLNAVVEDRFELAIAEAKEIDRMIANSKLTTTLDEIAAKYPLLGLPLTVKESIAVNNMSHSAGRRFPVARRATTDADVVRLCREAGAIPLLVSNTPELCLNFETYNKVTGTTCNPYDTRRTPGGSSGGEAALLAAGASLIGIGSDLGGSLRLPANFCGIWSHKPSAEIVSSDGHYPTCSNKEAWNRVFTLGPMTRYACDLPLMLNVMVKDERRAHLHLKDKVNLQKIKFYYLSLHERFGFTQDVETSIVIIIKRLLSYLKLTLSFEIQEIKINNFRQVSDSLFPEMMDLKSAEPLFENGPFRELFKFLTFRSNSVFPTIIYGISKQLYDYIPSGLKLRNEKIVREVRQQLLNILGENGVLIHPGHTTPANFHGQVYSKLGDYAYTTVFNVLGFPVTNCPLGLECDGLPIGVQIAASPYNDRLTLAVAQQIEESFGGWVPPIFADDELKH